ncbi:MAG: hypothetical protein NTX71_08175 [Candidatus Aureabacteria bacterium]|nr:hypothetical protein [Candidatus Auribacterota bacterium]
MLELFVAARGEYQELDLLENSRYRGNAEAFLAVQRGLSESNAEVYRHLIQILEQLGRTNEIKIEEGL